MITIEKTICIDIDIDDIIATGELTHSSSWEEVKAAVNDWVLGLDDCDYYRLDSDDITTICTAVGNQIFTEKDNNINHAEVDDDKTEDYWRGYQDGIDYATNNSPIRPNY